MCFVADVVEVAYRDCNGFHNPARLKQTFSSCMAIDWWRPCDEAEAVDVDAAVVFVLFEAAAMAGSVEWAG